MDGVIWKNVDSVQQVNKIDHYFFNNYIVSYGLQMTDTIVLALRSPVSI
jgi:hypothetical protein